MFDMHIHGPQRRNPNDFDGSLTFLWPQQQFKLFTCEVPQQHWLFTTPYSDVHFTQRMNPNDFCYPRVWADVIHDSLDFDSVLSYLPAVRVFILVKVRFSSCFYVSVYLFALVISNASYPNEMQVRHLNLFSSPDEGGNSPTSVCYLTEMPPITQSCV